MRRLAVPFAAALLALACRTPEEKLVDRRRDLREALDRLYAEYGGSDGTREHGGDRGGPDAPRAAPAGGGGVVGRLVQELDRTHFEESCLAIGRGERTFVLSGRLDAFLREPAHSRACRDAARIDLDVAALEREVQGAR